MLRYLIERKAYDRMLTGNTNKNTFRTAKGGSTAIHLKIKANFMQRYEEVKEMHDLLRLAIDEKHTLLKNIYEELDFKLKIIEEEKEKEPFEVMLKRYEKSLDGKFKQAIEDKFSRLESTLAK